MNTLKTQTLSSPRLITPAAGAMALMLLAGGRAPAVDLYSENFTGTASPQSVTNVGWITGGVNIGTYGDSANPTNWYTWFGDGGSGDYRLSTNESPLPISAANRIETQLSLDFAATSSALGRGMRWVVKVGSSWYTTDLFGLGGNAYLTAGTGAVSQWRHETLNIETAKWYLWDDTPYGGDSDFSNGYVSQNRLTPGINSTAQLLPAGAISYLGLYVWNNLNQQAWAVDNYVVSGVAAADTFTWDGTAADNVWANGNWTKGASTGLTPSTDTPMFIDLAASNVAVAADFTSASSVTVGQNNSAALTVNSGVTLTATKKVTVGPSGTLQLDGTLTAPTVSSQGAVTVSSTGAFGATTALYMSGGALTSSVTNLTLSSMTVSAGTLNLNGNNLTVDNLNLLVGANVNTGAGQLIANTGIAVDGATLTVGKPVTVPTLQLLNGGNVAFTGTGSMAATGYYKFKNTTTALDLTGAASQVIVGEDRLTDQTVKLTGTGNTYGGKTSIWSGFLEVNADAANLGAGLLEFNCPTFQDGQFTHVAIFQTSGTFARTIGTSAGQVYWQENGGFAAAGGDLTVTLTPQTAGNLDWSSATNGFRGKALFLNSPTATNKVTLTNNIDLKADRTVLVLDNTSTTNDYAELSGTIANGDATARGLTKNGAGKLVLSGNNTYSGSTGVNQGTLEVSSPGNLGLSTSVDRALAIGTSTVTRLLNDSSTDFAKSVQVWGNAGIYVDRTGTSASGNTHTLGALWINGNRTLTITGGNGYGLTFGAAKADDSATITNNAPGMLTLASLAETNASAKTITIRGTGNTTISGTVTQGAGALSLIKDDAGTLFLNGGGSYLGTTQVTNGKLFVNGDQSLATGNVTVNGGKTLGGTGTIGGNVTIANNARLAFNLITPYTSHDHLALAATKTMTFGATVYIDITGGGTAAPGDYILVAGVSGTEPTTYNVAPLPLNWAADAPRFVSGNLKINITSTGDPYAAWALVGSGDGAFDADANNDGVTNGMAWMLGAANKNVSALDKLPTVSQSGGGLVLTFNCLSAANRGTAVLNVQHSSDLGITDPWADALVPGTEPLTVSVGGVDFVTTANAPLIHVVATIPSGNAVAGKLFGRLNVVK